MRQPPILAASILVLGMLVTPARAQSPDPAQRPDGIKVRIVLVGDSTVTDNAGWGGAFKQLLKADTQCINLSRGGRSSRSFVNEGHWSPALALKPDYILIQFGHNDQPGKGPERETDPQTTYLEFMGRYVDEARAAGAKPVLVTSMTRRRFTPEGKIRSDLVPYVEAVKQLAKDKNVPLVDLHARSIELLNEMGPTKAEALDPPPAPSTQPSTQPARPDKTHLTPEGARLMAGLVAAELKKVVPELAVHFN